MYSFIYIRIDLCSNFIKWFTAIITINYIDVQFIPNLVSGNLFPLDPTSFWHVPVIL